MRHSDPTENPGPHDFDAFQTATDSSDSVYFYFDEPGDTTLKPCRPGLPRNWPVDVPFPGAQKPNAPREPNS